jgi:hypothetical protein
MAFDAPNINFEMFRDGGLASCLLNAMFQGRLHMLE